MYRRLMIETTGRCTCMSGYSLAAAMFLVSVGVYIDRCGLNIVEWISVRGSVSNCFENHETPSHQIWFIHNYDVNVRNILLNKIVLNQYNGPSSQMTTPWRRELSSKVEDTQGKASERVLTSLCELMFRLTSYEGWINQYFSPSSSRSEEWDNTFVQQCFTLDVLTGSSCTWTWQRQEKYKIVAEILNRPAVENLQLSW